MSGKFVQELEALLLQDEIDASRLPPEKPNYNLEWVPSLSETQLKVYKDNAANVLVHGEKYTGKSWVLGGHKLVHHCVHNINALAFVITLVQKQGNMGGVWDKLFTHILPNWRDKMGLKYTNERASSGGQKYFHILNKYGTWCKVVYFSLNSSSKIEGTLPGVEPTYVYVDELTLFKTDTIYTTLNGQLGRNQNVEHQQFTASCNPAGRKHWVYKLFFETALDGNGNYKPEYSVYHLPFEENAKNAPKGYRERLMSGFANNYLAMQRLVHGEWIDAPTGDSIFESYWIPQLNIRGSLDDGTRIIPNKNYPIYIGYDLGSRFHAMVFLQRLVGTETTIWTVFDEVVIIGKKIQYKEIAIESLNRMHFWNKHCETRFNFIHISDSAATNQWRPAEGSVDAASYSEACRKLIASSTSKYKEIAVPKLEAAPKYAGSKRDRVKLTRALLISGRLLVSATCESVVDMFNRLESEQKPNEDYDEDAECTPKRMMDIIHTFDAMSYPIHKVEPSVATRSISSSVSTIKF